MSAIKLLKVDCLTYSQARKHFLSLPLWAEEPSFDALMHAFDEASIAYGCGLSRAFEALGYEVMQVVSNLEPLQLRWMAEHNPGYERDGGWEVEILCAQVEAFRPEVVIFQGMPVTPRDFKSRFPFVKQLLAISGYPLPADCLHGADTVFACASGLVEYYRKMGLGSELLHHGFDAALLDRVQRDPCNTPYEFSFLGSSGYGIGAASSARYWFLVGLLLKTPLVAWIDENLSCPQGDEPDCLELSGEDKYKLLETWQSLLNIKHELLGKKANLPAYRKRLSKLIARIRLEDAQQLPLFPLSFMFPYSCHPPLYGLEMIRTLAQSRVVFNRHTNAATEIRVVGNMRMFEAAGMGACLLTDTGENMRELFDPDYEVVTYASLDECQEKISFLLSHPDQARQIGEAGQRRVLREHTYLRRAEEMDSVIRKMLA